jgi:hypothetical protein
LVKDESFNFEIAEPVEQTLDVGKISEITTLSASDEPGFGKDPIDAWRIEYPVYRAARDAVGPTIHAVLGFRFPQEIGINNVARGSGKMVRHRYAGDAPLVLFLGKRACANGQDDIAVFQLLELGPCGRAGCEGDCRPAGVYGTPSYIRPAEMLALKKVVDFRHRFLARLTPILS